jgi:predicted nucleic acid-binding protein
LTTYWDSSAVVNATVSPSVMARLNTGRHFTRLHTLSEVFAVLTGRGIPLAGAPARFKLTQNDCARWLRTFMTNVELLELNKAEILDALDRAQARGIQGNHVYDYVHALACDQAKADELVTRNASDFVGLAKARIVRP